jgi:hypothetical protein
MITVSGEGLNKHRRTLPPPHALLLVADHASPADTAKQTCTLDYCINLMNYYAIIIDYYYYHSDQYQI